MSKTYSLNVLYQSRHQQVEIVRRLAYSGWSLNLDGMMSYMSKSTTTNLGGDWVEELYDMERVFAVIVEKDSAGECIGFSAITQGLEFPVGFFLTPSNILLSFGNGERYYEDSKIPDINFLVFKIFKFCENNNCDILKLNVEYRHTF